MTGDLPEFCDTNVLVYAHDLTAGTKRELAARLLGQLCAEDRCCLSTQVLTEFYVTATRKLPQRMTHHDAVEIVADLSACVRLPTGVEDVAGAIHLAHARQLSLWDALIITAALRCSAMILWSEDLQDGARYGDLEVRNPFLR